MKIKSASSELANEQLACKHVSAVPVAIQSFPMGLLVFTRLPATEWHLQMEILSNKFVSFLNLLGDAYATFSSTLWARSAQTKKVAQQAVSVKLFFGNLTDTVMQSTFRK